MDRVDEEIGQELRRITRTDGVGGPLMTGHVVAGSIDEGELTCSVLLTMNTDGNGGGAATDGVLLSSVGGDGNGFILYPADGSDVVVGEVDGGGVLTLVRCSKLVKMEAVIGGKRLTLTGDGLLLNGDGLGALPVLQKVQDNLDTLKKYIKNTLEPAIKNAFTAVGVGSGASGPSGATSFSGAVGAKTIDFEDMGNKNVKQG